MTFTLLLLQAASDLFINKYYQTIIQTVLERERKWGRKKNFLKLKKNPKKDVTTKLIPIIININITLNITPYKYMLICRLPNPFL